MIILFKIIIIKNSSTNFINMYMKSHYPISIYKSIPNIDISAQNSLIIGKSISSTSTLVLNPANHLYYIKRTLIPSSSKPLAKIINDIDIYYHMHHKNILRIFSSNENQSSLDIVINYAKKGSLSSIIKKEGRLTEEVSFLYFYQILNVIYYLHRKKRMYLRKLSPEDIFIDGNNKVIISDFTQSVIREKNKKANRFYDKNEDFYKLGFVLLAMTHGINNSNREIIDRKIISRECADLIKLLIDLFKSKKRTKVTFKMIYEHEWIINNLNKNYLKNNSLTKFSTSEESDDDEINSDNVINKFKQFLNDKKNSISAKSEQKCQIDNRYQTEIVHDVSFFTDNTYKETINEPSVTQSTDNYYCSSLDILKEAKEAKKPIQLYETTEIHKIEIKSPKKSIVNSVLDFFSFG